MEIAAKTTMILKEKYLMMLGVCMPTYYTSMDCHNVIFDCMTLYMCTDNGKGDARRGTRVRERRVLGAGKVAVTSILQCMHVHTVLHKTVC